MKNFLITGISSGLGKYLFQNIDHAVGLSRNNFDEIKDFHYDILVHCAFNKSNVISDYKQYLYDNIILTQKLKNIKCNKFIYISSIDIYSSSDNVYSMFKKFSEVLLDEKDLSLRCSAMVGDTMKPSSLTKLHDNVESISLSGKSSMNYILYKDILKFVSSQYIKNHNGFIDFVSNGNISIDDVKNLFNSNTNLGNYEYTSLSNFHNPVFKYHNEYDKSSLEVLKEYYGI